MTRAIYGTIMMIMLLPISTYASQQSKNRQCHPIIKINLALATGLTIIAALPLSSQTAQTTPTQSNCNKSCLFPYEFEWGMDKRIYERTCRLISEECVECEEPINELHTRLQFVKEQMEQQRQRYEKVIEQLRGQLRLVDETAKRTKQNYNAYAMTLGILWLALVLP